MLIKLEPYALIIRLKRVASGKWTVIGEDQRFGGDGFRQDLILQKDNDILITDVTGSLQK